MVRPRHSISKFVETQFNLLPRRSAVLLFIIVVTAVAAVLSLKKYDSPILGVAFLVLFGITVTVACLFAFPYANIWGDPAPGQPDQPGQGRDYNDIRNMLIAAVVGAFTLSGLYFTFRSADASSRSALETKQAAETQAERQARSEVGQAVRLMASKEPVSSTAGLYVLEELLDQENISQALADKLVTLYVKHNAASPFETGQDWRTMSDDARRARIDSRKIGIGSLEKRAGDIQFALGVLSAHDKVKDDRGLYTPRVDLRDLHLEGAAFGHAKLQGALFSGAHLDYLDTRTSSGPYADFQSADFQGATLFGAYLNNANLTGAKLATPSRADGTPRVEQMTLLRYASLRGANLTGADLSGADLDHADLRGANLRGAKLTGANLNGAQLGGADLTDARVAGEELVGARYNLSTAWPDGRWVSGAPEDDQRTGRLCRVKSCLVVWQVLKTGTFPAA